MADVTAKGWLLIRAQRRDYGPTSKSGQYAVKSLRIMRYAANKPDVGPDEEAVEIAITFPDGYFDTNSPKIEVVIPAPVQDTPQDAVYAEVRPMKPSAAAAVIGR